MEGNGTCTTSYWQLRHLSTMTSLLLFVKTWKQVNKKFKTRKRRFSHRMGGNKRTRNAKKKDLTDGKTIPCKSRETSPQRKENMDSTENGKNSTVNAVKSPECGAKKFDFVDKTSTPKAKRKKLDSQKKSEELTKPKLTQNPSDKDDERLIIDEDEISAEKEIDGASPPSQQKTVKAVVDGIALEINANEHDFSDESTDDEEVDHRPKPSSQSEVDSESDTGVSEEDLDYSDYQVSEYEIETDSEQSEMSSESEPEAQRKYQRMSKKKRSRGASADRSRSRSRSRSKRKSEKRRRMDRGSESEVDELLSLREVQKKPRLRKLIQNLTRKQKRGKRDEERKRSRSTSRHRGPHKKKKRTSPRKLSKRSKCTGKELKQTKQIKAIDSPSQLTVYTPAVNKIVGPGKNVVLNSPQNKRHIYTENEVNKILQNLRLSNDSNVSFKIVDSAPSSPDLNYNNDRRGPRRDRKRDPGEEQIIEAEKYKASIAVPNAGKDESTSQNAGPVNLNKYMEEEVDELFDLTCHIDDALKSKIQRGEYVELEKLLPKTVREMRPENEELMEQVNRGGHSYFVPVKSKEKKITHFKKWEEAFKVYMSIYSQANPSRATEIMQYHHTISRGASLFAWENVYQYDYLFRQKIGKKPYLSWARTNTQMWVTLMITPINRSNNNGNNQGSGGGKKDWREIACWRFNRNKCNRSASECKFEHRCSLCGSFSHIYSQCSKKSKKHGKKGDKPEPAQNKAQ